jgi:hypothetical protein
VQQFLVVSAREPNDNYHTGLESLGPILESHVRLNSSANVLRVSSVGELKGATNKPVKLSDLL